MTNKGGADGTGQANSTTTTTTTTECCMCGDPGFSDQLFQCKVCQFRSQHRYCSNLYPKVEYFGSCNWCLNQKELEKYSPNSSNSSSPNYNRNYNSSADDEIKNKKMIRKLGLIRGSSTALQLQLQKPIKKQHKQLPPETTSPSASTSPSPSPSPLPVLISTRKRIITNGALEERLRRTKSEDITNTSAAATATAIKQVFRNKVRRYKLLDEVSS